jgi:hypothetical protein
MGNTGGVLYVRDNAAYKQIRSGDFSGAFMFTNKCSFSAPLIVLPDQANSGTPLFDNGLTGGLSNASGICFGDYCTSVWVVGLHVTNGNFTMMYSASNHCTDVVLYKCESDNYRSAGSNAAGFRYDHSTRTLADKCYFHEIYSTDGGHTANDYPAVASGFHEGAEAFHAKDARFTRCEFDLCEYGVFQKQPPASGNSVDVSHCLFKRFQRSTSAGGAPIALLVAGEGGPAVVNALVRYSVHEGNLETDGTSTAFVYMNPDGGNQSTTVDVYHNVARNNGGGIHFAHAEYARCWNNISEDAGGPEITLQAPYGSGVVTELLYSDYNLYVRSPLQWRTHYGGGTVLYESLAAWQGASDTYLPNQPDLNSTTTNTTPSYTDANGYDYRATTSAGRGGRQIGVGQEPVGRAV